MPALHRVFVYGSLLSGLHNHRCLAGATPRGPATLDAGAFAMLDLVGFPGLVDAPGPDAPLVVGELYDVDDDGLARLDRLEGHPTHYRRRRVVPTGGGATAWVYVLANTDKTAAHRRTPLVPRNDWRAVAEARR